MDLNDKIKQILVDKSISPSHFADEIGVQRSSVSHILSGRNKPSLDIVQKIIKRYPDLGMEWIMDEEDLPDIEPDRSESKPESPNRTDRFPQVPSPSELPEKKIPAVSTLQTNLGGIDNGQNHLSAGQKDIEKILVFYADGTFKQYIPS